MKNGGYPLTTLSLRLMPRPFSALLVATMTIKRLLNEPPAEASAITIGALLMGVEGLLPYRLYTRWVVFELEIDLKRAEQFCQQAHLRASSFALEGGFLYVGGAPSPDGRSPPKRR